VCSEDVAFKIAQNIQDNLTNNLAFEEVYWESVEAAIKKYRESENRKQEEM